MPTPCPPVYVPVHNATSCVMSVTKHAFMSSVKPITTAVAHITSLLDVMTKQVQTSAHLPPLLQRSWMHIHMNIEAEVMYIHMNVEAVLQILNYIFLSL